MSPARRDDYAAVGRAIRAGTAIIAAADDVPDAALRVWVAVITTLGSWSRLDDTTTRDHLGATVGVHTRTVSRGITWLVDNGVVEWTPGRKNKASRLSIRHLAGTELSETTVGALTEELSETTGVLLNPSQQDNRCPTDRFSARQIRHLSETDQTPQRDNRCLTPEDVPEDSSRERVPNTPDATPTEEEGIDEERILADTLDHMARMDLDYATHEGAVIHSPARWLTTARQNLDRIHGTDIIRLAHGITDPHPVDIAANIDYRYMTPERRRHHDDTRTARQRAEDAERRAGSQAFIAWRTDADQRIAAADPHDIERAVALLELDPELPAPDRHQLRTWAMANLPQPEGATA